MEISPSKTVTAGQTIAHVRRSTQPSARRRASAPSLENLPDRAGWQSPRGARAGAARQRFARAALIDAQFELGAGDDLHKARIDPFGKTRMRFKRCAIRAHRR